MPISVSHEGYLAQPVHSYWDDFWALRGLRDAVDLAHVVERPDAAERWEALATRFASALFGSIEKTRAERKLDFIPGSVEWADFDPTATANAIAFLDVAEGLDRKAVEHTFDKYLSDWRRKRSGSPGMGELLSVRDPHHRRSRAAWAARCWRSSCCGSFCRTGDRQRGISGRRLRGGIRRAPAHVGDLPHTWVAAEYVLAVRSLFAYERAADRRLVVAAGLAPEWTTGPGVQVQAMPTLYGA